MIEIKRGKDRKWFKPGNDSGINEIVRTAFEEIDD